ncbi:MAG: TetR/AcrR family transcriptional regulator [Acidimicrobiales bacterium]
MALAGAAPGVSDPRTRILDAALALMSDQGFAGTSMRQLAGACELNVATLYHYFPSKADLLQSVIEERRYGERLATDVPVLNPSTSPRDRLAGLLEWLWTNALDEEAVWRLLIGESVRGEEAAAESATEVVNALALALEGWLTDGFPELSGDRGALARVIRGQVFALVVEHLALGAVTPAVARQRARELAAVVFP